jgi:uncharacterized membrane protein
MDQGTRGTLLLCQADVEPGSAESGSAGCRLPRPPPMFLPYAARSVPPAARQGTMDAARSMWSTDAMQPTPSDGLVRLTHVIYGLHAFSAVMGVISSAAVVTAFLTGWPSVLAVILNYARRSGVRGTYLESHFRWQIRTFWFAALWVVVSVCLFVTVIGIPLAWLLVVATGVWVLYRIVRGWLALNEGRAIEL